MTLKQNTSLIRNKRKQLKPFYGFTLFFCALFIASFVFFAPSSKAVTPNESINFLVDSSYDYKDRPNIDATLRNISDYALFYVENEYYDSLRYVEKNEFDSDLETLSSNFDDTIYPKMRAIFGEEWNPGIDDNSHITILFTKTKDNVGGYFNPNDEYFKGNVVDDKSNEREMLYLNAIFIGNERLESFIAHEFQHMITWHHKTKLKNINDDIWLNEARSEYASTAVGYDDDYKKSNLRARTENLMRSEIENDIPIPNQNDSLTEWQNKIRDYSSVNLFSQYLADHFGNNIFKSMITNYSTGIESIEKALNNIGYPNTSFSEIYTNWTIANYLNNKYYQDGKYGYSNPNLTYENFHLKPTASYFVSNTEKSINISASIKDWSSRYYEIKPSGDLVSANIEIYFDGDNLGRFSVPYALLSGDSIISVNRSVLDSNQNNKIYIKNFGKDITSIILMPNSQKRMDSFGSDVESYSYLISIKTIEQNLYPDGTILKSYKSPEVFLIEDGKKKWITSSAALISNGYSWDNLTYVNSNELDMFERGENIYARNLKPNGTLVRGSGPKVYVIESGQKRWITSAGAFISGGYEWENVLSISETELDSYADGPNIAAQNLKPDGMLIKGSGSEVYLLEGGKKRWITSAKVFLSRQYKWEHIAIVPDIELASYEDGLNISK